MKMTLMEIMGAIGLGKILGSLSALVFEFLILSSRSSILEKAFSPGGVLLVLPLVLIWFPDTLGSLTGYRVKGGTVNAESPAILVSFMGWFFLVGWPVLYYLLDMGR